MHTHTYRVPRMSPTNLRKSSRVLNFKIGCFLVTPQVILYRIQLRRVLFVMQSVQNQLLPCLPVNRFLLKLSCVKRKRRPSANPGIGPRN